MLLASLFIAVSLSSTPAAAVPVSASPLVWDAVGHRAIAAIAYTRLTPATRAKVDALLRVHPDLDSLAKGVEVTTPDGARELFMRASVWPDRIRGDARFYNETGDDVTPTPRLPGFPDMARHGGWHYLSQSFSTDGTPPQKLEEPSSITALARLAADLGDEQLPAEERAYGLSWILHLVGDLHQPMHGTSRSSAQHPNGDAGGNRVMLLRGPETSDSINLHAFWDGLIGRAFRGTEAPAIAERLMAQVPVAEGSADVAVAEGATLFDIHDLVRTWTTESSTLARYVAYDIENRREGALPTRVHPSYDRLAQLVARQRVVLAGYRLAALIEARL